MDVFPAFFSASLINFDPSIPAAPVVGWAHCGNGRCLPLVLGRPGGLVTGDAIRAAGTERVFDLIAGLNFDDEDAWRAHIEENEPYRAGLTSPLLSYPGSLVIQPKQPPEAKLAELPKAGELPHVEFGGKVYAKQTFWQAPAGQAQVVFVLEKNTPCPLSGAEKITRESYYELRKSIVEVHQSVFSKPDPNQPELPLTGETPEPEEDDDVSDLV